MQMEKSVTTMPLSVFRHLEILKSYIDDFREIMGKMIGIIQFLRIIKPPECMLWITCMHSMDTLLYEPYMHAKDNMYAFYG